MIDEQPEALRLATNLEWHPERYCEDAAAELRRLYEAHDWQYKMAGERLRRIEKLEAEVKRLRDALAQAVADIRKADQESVMRREYDAAVDAVVKRLTVALAQRGEA